jgi:hypothetical protein
MAQKQMAFRKFMRFSKREAFECGFFRIFGLTSYPVEAPKLSPSEALQEDCFTIAHDFNRVFEREAELINEDVKSE